MGRMHIDVHRLFHPIAPVFPHHRFICQVPGTEYAGAGIEPGRAFSVGIHLHVRHPVDQVPAAVVAGLHVRQAEGHLPHIQIMQHAFPCASMIFRHIYPITSAPIDGGADHKPMPCINGRIAPITFFGGNIFHLSDHAAPQPIPGHPAAGAIPAIAGIPSVNILAAGPIGRIGYIQVFIAKGASLRHQPMHFAAFHENIFRLFHS